MADMEVTCSFQAKCKNFNKLCNRCRWNAKNDLGDHLLIEENGKTLRFL